MTDPIRISRQELRRRRRRMGLAVLALPGAWIGLLELSCRGPELLRFDRLHALGYVVSFVGACVFWGLLLYVAARRRGRVARLVALVFVLLFVLALGTQAAFVALFRFYLARDAQVGLDSIPSVLTGAMPMTRPIVLLHWALATVGAVIMVKCARRFVRPAARWRRRVPWAIPVVLYLVAKVPVSYRTVQSTTPDLLYFHGLIEGVKERLGSLEGWSGLHVQPRTPERVPRLSPRPARARNVLMIVQEALRADVSCTAYEADCQLATRASNALLPHRLPLMQMRASSSSTAISLSNLWAGVSPAARREVMLSAPLLWEYAHAAGYFTAYWTSQHLMFGNSRLYVQDLPLDSFCSATTLDWHADMFAGATDRALSDYVIREWDGLKEPFLAVVHYSNIHTPRIYDARFAPFQPAQDSHQPSPQDERYKNFYKNVVYLSDLAVAHLLRHVRASAKGDRTVVVYTADHGESYREHGQQSDHSSSIFEEEIRVPAWIDAPAGTLSPDEEAQLRRTREEQVWHLDVPPTILDLLGVWDDPGLAPFRARMLGHPLTRSERTSAPVPLTTASWVWEDPLPVWGMMQGSLKIQARNFDTRYHCYDVAADPRERRDLGEAACAALVASARDVYGGAPGSIPRLRDIAARR
jgi:hypothetical protein